MKNWILEVGNTRAKWACFECIGDPSAPPLKVHSTRSTDVQVAPTWQREVQAEDRVMVTGSGDLGDWIHAFPTAFILRPGDPIPLNTGVTEPTALGLDRVANAWAVIHNCFTQSSEHQAWMIVDVGTCVTLDVVQHTKHLGGVISPGVKMRMKAMAEGTARLPQPNLLSQNKHPMAQSLALGNNTENALLRGGLGGLSAEIEGTWASLNQKIPDMGVLLTGGDALRLELRDILPTFADAHLTLKGFHAIFKHLYG